MGVSDVLFAFIIVYLIIIIIALIFSVFQIIALWKLYEKAGEPGWSTLVPVYNYFQMIKIATGNPKIGWAYLGICVLYFIGGGATVVGNESSVFIVSISMIALIVLACYISYMFAKSFGKSTAFCVLSIFFSGITFLIMGFDKNTKYVGPNGIPLYSKSPSRFGDEYGYDNSYYNSYGNNGYNNNNANNDVNSNNINNNYNNDVYSNSNDTKVKPDININENANTEKSDKGYKDYFDEL